MGNALDALVPIRLVRLAELMSRLSTQVFETRYGVRNIELRILGVIGGRGSLTVNELARRAQVDKGWISRSLTPMEKRGLLRREDHPTNRRQTVVALTAEGEAVLAQISALAIARNEQLLEGLDPAVVNGVIDELMARTVAELDPPRD